MGIAHELITRGWSQGSIRNLDDDARCLVGAAAAAFGDIEAYVSRAAWVSLPSEVRLALLRAVPPNDVIGGVGRVTAFNDAHGRTYDEVLRAAKEADELLGL